MVSAFVLITMDNWDSNAKNLAHITNNNALAFSFTILSQIIGVLIILNLFLAFLLAQLDDFDLSDEEAQAYHPSASLSSQSLNMGPSNNGQNIEASVNIKAIPDLSPFVSEDPFKESSSFAGKDLFSNPNQLEGSIKTKFKSTRLSGSLSGEGALSSRGLLRGKKSLSMFFSDQIRGMQAKINQEREQALSPDSLEGTSLNLFGRKNTMRIFLFKVLNTYLFYNLMLVVVVASCIELCLDNDTVQPGSPLAKAIYVMDIMFVVIFGMEALMKIIVFGLFWNGPKSYLKSGW